LPSAILAQTSLTAENRTLANAPLTGMIERHIKARPPQSASSSAAAPVAWKLAIEAGERARPSAGFFDGVRRFDVLSGCQLCQSRCPGRCSIVRPHGALGNQGDRPPTSQDQNVLSGLEGDQLANLFGQAESPQAGSVHRHL
jgi:hypothetical protein